MRWLFDLAGEQAVFASLSDWGKGGKFSQIGDGVCDRIGFDPVAARPVGAAARRGVA